MTRGAPRPAPGVAFLAVLVASLWTGSETATCTGAGADRRHRASVMRVERCAAAGIRSLTHR